MSDAPRRWWTSYRSRLVLGYVLVTAVLAAAWAWSLYGPLDSSVLEQQKARLLNVSCAGAVAIETSSEASIGAVARRLVADGDLRMTIVAADGRVIADTGADATRMENHLGRPEIAAALAGRVGTDVRRSRTQAIDEVYVAVPAAIAGARVAVRFSEPLARVTDMAAQARTSGLVVLFLALGVSLFVAARLSAGSAAPVERLASAARAMARGERYDVAGESGELGELSEALNDLGSQVRGKIGELEGEQRNLRAVLDGLPDAILLLDVETVRLANTAATAMFKAPFGGWPGRPLGDAGLPESLAQAVRACLGSGEASAVDVGPDTAGRMLRVTTVPLAPSETGSRTLVIVSDVTERTLLDEVRREFVANAAHELKTPASAIQLLADTATTAAADGDTTTALGFVGQMKAEAERLRRLVADLLDLSRLEGGGPADVVTDVREAVDLALAAHRPAATASGLALDLDSAGAQGQDLYVAAEPTDLAVALDNLLANAIAYTERGGVTVRLACGEAAVTIAVEDTGVGIPAADLPRIFERFYRVDRGRSRESGGTGLGLSLVKHVVERSGGTVTVASEVGAGSTFTVTFPRMPRRRS